MEIIIRRWEHLRLKYTFLLLFSLILFYYFTQTEVAKSLIEDLGQSGFLGAVAGGIFFVSSYTVAPAAYVLHAIGQNISLVAVALLGGLGAMIGDYLIFRFVRDRLAEEWRPYFKKARHRKPGRPKKQSRAKRWGIIALGGFIIASPLPDEAGVGLLGLTNMKVLHFLMLAYVLNSAGILAIMLIARSL